MVTLANLSSAAGGEAAAALADPLGAALALAADAGVFGLTGALAAAGAAEARCVADGAGLGAAVGAADGPALADVAALAVPGAFGGPCPGFAGSVAWALALGTGGRDSDAVATGS